MFLSRGVSHDLAEAISSTVANCKILLGNVRQPIPSAIRPRHNLDSAYPANINAQVI